MNMQPADVLDRLSIVMLHLLHGNDEVVPEYADLLSDATHYMEGEVFYRFMSLFLANGKIWNLESDIRKGKEGQMSLEEVGKRALLIRDLNKARVTQKNEIASIVGGFKHVKTDHASA